MYRGNRCPRVVVRRESSISQQAGLASRVRVWARVCVCWRVRPSRAAAVLVPGVHRPPLGGDTGASRALPSDFPGATPVGGGLCTHSQGQRRRRGRSRGPCLCPPSAGVKGSRPVKDPPAECVPRPDASPRPCGPWPCPPRPGTRGQDGTGDAAGLSSRGSSPILKLTRRRLLFPLRLVSEAQRGCSVL